MGRRLVLLDLDGVIIQLSGGPSRPSLAALETIAQVPNLEIYCISSRRSLPEPGPIDLDQDDIGYFYSFDWLKSYLARNGAPTASIRLAGDLAFANRHHAHREKDSELFLNGLTASDRVLILDDTFNLANIDAPGPAQLKHIQPNPNDCLTAGEAEKGIRFFRNNG